MDMNQYLDLFLEESMEHVQILNENLLALEGSPERIDLIDEIFRAAHTLKGMAATMGFEGIAQLTHKMENLLDKLRQGELILTPDIFNVLFRAVDALEHMISDIRSGQSPSYDITELTEAFLLMEKGQNPPCSTSFIASQEYDTEIILENLKISFNEFEKNVIQNATEKGLNVWNIVIEISKDCIMKGVRAFMVIRAMEGLGEIIKAVPHIQELEDEKFDKDFTIVLISSVTEQEIKESINKISETYIGNIFKISLDPKTVNHQIRKPNGGPKTNMVRTSGGGNGIGEKKQQIHQTIRVDIGRLDKLMSLVGELVINKTRLEQIYISNNLGDLNESIEQINRITTDLQAVVQNVRMVPIEQVFNRFPRMVRDLAKELGKEAELILEGKETELDRTVIDEIGDPLVHLIRNGIDHGLETPEERINKNKKPEGTLKLSAKHEGNHVLIVVEDDGKGMDVEAIKQRALQNGLIDQKQAEEMEESAILNLIFEPGFSTAEAVTDISGRGVGLDVVKNKITSLSGQVSLETKKGNGSRFIIKLPLTLAIIQALLVNVQDEIYAIPLANIDETTILDPEQIKNVQGQQVMLLRKSVLPLLSLKEILSVPGNKDNEELYVVVVRKGEQQVGLIVDALVGQQEIVINSVGKLLSGLPGLAGASILGDGRISLILDIATLF